MGKCAQELAYKNTPTNSDVQWYLAITALGMLFFIFIFILITFYIVPTIKCTNVSAQLDEF